MLVIALLAALSLQDRLARIDAGLKAGHFEPAQQQLRGLTNTITEHFGSGSQAMYTVAVIASFRAIAAAGLHNSKDAEWYWSIAKSLYPKFGGSNLGVYGAAGESVMRIDKSESCDLAELPTTAHVRPPKPMRTPLPKYPYHAIETGIAEPITVQVIVTESGTTRCPRVVETHDDPSLAWVLLEAMKEWQYEPAMRDGVRTPVRIDETVDFRITYH